MKQIKEKPEWMCEYGHRYVYRIYRNGAGGYTLSVQTIESFEEKYCLDNVAYCSMPTFDYWSVSMTLDIIQKIFKYLTRHIREDGYYCEYIKGSIVEI